MTDITRAIIAASMRSSSLVGTRGDASAGVSRCRSLPRDFAGTRALQRVALNRPPDAGEPGLLLARQPGRTVIVLELGEAGPGQVAPPGLEVVVGAVAAAVPAFLVVAVRVGAEEHAARLQRGAQLAQHPRQLAAGHMEKGCVGENAVEARRRQLEAQEILLPDLAAAVLARHRRKARRAVQADRHVAERAEG